MTTLFIHGRNGGQATAVSDNGTEWGIGCMAPGGHRGRVWASFDRDAQVWRMGRAPGEAFGRLSDAMHAALEMVCDEEAFLARGPRVR